MAPAYAEELLQAGIPNIVERLVLNHHLLEGRVSDITGEVRVVQRVQNEIHLHAAGVNQALATLDVKREEGQAKLLGQMGGIKSELEKAHSTQVDEMEKRITNLYGDGEVIETLRSSNSVLESRVTAIEGRSLGNAELSAISELLLQHQQLLKDDIWDAVSQVIKSKFEGILQQKIEQLEQNMEVLLM